MSTMKITIRGAKFANFVYFQFSNTIKFYIHFTNINTTFVMHIWHCTELDMDSIFSVSVSGSSTKGVSRAIFSILKIKYVI